MIAADLPVKGADIVVLGMTFKENCADLRNSKVIDVIRELRTYGAHVFVHDPIANSLECEREYGITLTTWDALPRAQAVVATVSHRQYLEMGLEQLATKLVKRGLFVDVKASFDADKIGQLGFASWRL
jgi:UDP-N-acetyl-D-galactosamine dehydrogenase